jgi:hypothetical protein
MSSRSPFLATELTNMTNQHPITPPPELVQQWFDSNGTYADDIRQAAQWGADQELEACCLLLDNGEYAASYGCHDGTSLRAARRPEPPSLKEQALDDFNGLMQELDGAGAYSNCADRIRRALKELTK